MDEINEYPEGIRKWMKLMNIMNVQDNRRKY